MHQDRSAGRVLVVAAHADDEVLGAGGALAMHKSAGDLLYFLIFSATSTSRKNLSDSDDDFNHRSRCARLVAEIYDAHLDLRDYLDNRFDTVPQLDLTQTVEEAISSFNPTVVYTHSLSDLSRDHELVARATFVAARPTPQACVSTILSFEVRSSTEWAARQSFRPTWFHPLTEEAMELKSQALSIYSSELREWPHTRSLEAVEAQIRLRGSHVGSPAAEAFEVVRHIADR